MVGYNPSLDPGVTGQTAFRFDVTARTLAIARIIEDIPRWLRPRASGVTFTQFFAENVNGTAASSHILKQALVRLVEEHEVEILGPCDAPRSWMEQVASRRLRPGPHQVARPASSSRVAERRCRSPYRIGGATRVSWSPMETRAHSMRWTPVVGLHRQESTGSPPRIPGAEHSP